MSPRDSGSLAEEHRLIASAQAGDASAFRVLVELHQHRAYALALRITRQPEDAEEVTQDAFVKVWNALPDFRGESRFSTWLHRIVLRRALDRADSLRRRRSHEADPIAMGDPVAAPEVVTDALGSQRLHRMLQQRLTRAQFEVVSLFYLEGCSVEQVATGISMNENTVKTHLARARAVLREAWLAEGGEPA